MIVSLQVKTEWAAVNSSIVLLVMPCDLDTDSEYTEPEVNTEFSRMYFEGEQPAKMVGGGHASTLGKSCEEGQDMEHLL